MPAHAGFPMNLYVVTYRADEHGCPLVLKGDLNHDWEFDTFDPNPESAEIRHSYTLRSKNPLIDFDFWNDRSIGSARFVEICRRHDAQIRTVPLAIIQSNKKRTAKDYFYVLWSDWLSIIDLDASDITLDRDLETGQVIHHRQFPAVPRCEAVRHFVVDPARLTDRQVFKCIDLDFELVCTEKFRDDCEAAGLSGLDFQPLDSFQRIPWFAYGNERA
jgi:hypothetical protein